MEKKNAEICQISLAKAVFHTLKIRMVTLLVDIY